MVVYRDSRIAPETAGVVHSPWNYWHVNIADARGNVDTVYQVRSKAKADAVAEFLNWRISNHMGGNLERWLEARRIGGVHGP